MVTVFRWLLRITLGALLVLFAALSLVWYFASRSLPDYDATEEVAGLTAPVEIVRDHANVPHIFGANDADVFFALGYAHAQDRLWQMQMLRRTAQGRLSELFGTRTVQIDMLMRRFDLYGLAQSSVAAQDPSTQEALTAYAAGVNAWLGEVNEGARGRGAPEMWLFNHPIAPWVPADSIAILKLMSVQLQSHLEAEVLRARVSLMLPSERVADILPDVPGAGTAALPEYASLVPGVPRYAANTEVDLGPLSPFPAMGFGGASNGWAAGISRSATGSTLLANDPHLELTAPTIWYLARLELQAGGVIGGTIPGIPLVLTGRSADLGWGITSSYLDDLDIHIEEVNPQNPDQYRTPDGWADFEARDSIIEVLDGAPVTIRLQWTTNGPVLPPELYNLGTIRPPGHVTSVAWTALDPADTTMTAGMRLMAAESVEAAIERASCSWHRHRF